MPDDKSVNNKRIAKNTIMLYIRMLLILSISLYTSRVVLKTLGENDYGIYNVVGGIVAMLGFINAAMSTSTQRYLTFELGKKNILKLREIFATSFSIHAIIALVIVIIAETAGLWFLNNKNPVIFLSILITNIYRIIIASIVNKNNFKFFIFLTF